MTGGMSSEFSMPYRDINALVLGCFSFVYKVQVVVHFLIDQRSTERKNAVTKICLHLRVSLTLRSSLLWPMNLKLQ
jgi:hypothetical protein